jgi:ubiquinol-cytochrome c reductase cytochrome b subunit
MLRAVTSEFLIPMWIFAAVLFGLLIRQTKEKKQQIKYAGILVVLAATFYLLDAKFWGVMVMGGSVVIFFFLPWLDNSPVKSIRYRPQFHKYIYGVFVVTFVILGYLGIQAPSPVGEKVSQIGTLIYFGFFLAMPWWSKMGEFKQVPKRVNFVAH